MHSEPGRSDSAMMHAGGVSLGAPGSVCTSMWRSLAPIYVGVHLLIRTSIRGKPLLV
jgi:hypothetical protein